MTNGKQKTCQTFNGVCLSLVCMFIAQCYSTEVIAQNFASPISKRSTVITPGFSGRKLQLRCNDKKDNDRDSLIDYPEDPNCRNFRDNSERPKSKTEQQQLPTPLPASGKEIPALGINASLQGRRPFPDDNPWNQDISAEPIDANSDTLIASIGEDVGLHPDFGTTWKGSPIGIPYVVVTGDQQKTTVSFDYADESDPGPYPIPVNPPIEGGEQSQGDRHVLIVDRDNWLLYELYNFQQIGTKYHAGSGAIFDLAYNNLRRAYVVPARHYASSNTSANLSPMGMRVRLKSSFDDSAFPAPVRVILKALKKYGMIVADNGSNWFISGAPDSRWDDEILASLRQVKGRNFEVVKMGSIVTE